ncbi:armadillo-type protein [Mycena leptocephala]|nr:armadillo-type protein [Mycena leptocephala]
MIIGQSDSLGSIRSSTLLTRAQSLIFALHDTDHAHCRRISRFNDKTVPLVMELLKDRDEDVRSTAAKAVGSLAMQAIFHDSIKLRVAQIEELLKDDDRGVRQTGIHTIVNLADQDVFRGPMKSVLPRMMELFTDEDADVQMAVALAVGKLAKHTIFHDSIEDYVSRIPALLKDGTWQERATGIIAAIVYLSEHDAFRDSVLNLFPHVMDLFETDELRAWVAYVMGTFAKHTEVHDSIEASLPLIAETLKHNEPAVRQEGIRAVIKLAEEDAFRHSLTDMVQRVIELLNDRDQNVQMLAAAAVGDLARHTVFRPSIEPVIPRIAELLKDSEWKVRFATIYTIIKLAEEGTFRDSITNIVPRSAELPHGQDARSVAVTAVCDLITQTAFNNTIETSVPRITELLNNPSWEVQGIGVRTIIKLAEQDVFRDSMGNIVPQVLELLKHEDEDVRSPAVDALGDLAKYTVFHDSVETSVPVIAEVLKDSIRNVRLSGIHTISKLAEQDTFHDSMIKILPEVMVLLGDHSYDIRSAAVALVGDLAKYNVFHDCLEPVPRIAGLLKDNEWKVRSSSIHAISKLADQGTTIEGILPQITEFLREESGYSNAKGYQDALKAGETLLQRFNASITSETTGVQQFTSDGLEIELLEAGGIATEPEGLLAPGPTCLPPWVLVQFAYGAELIARKRRWPFELRGNGHDGILESSTSSSLNSTPSSIDITRTPLHLITLIFLLHIKFSAYAESPTSFSWKSLGPCLTALTRLYAVPPFALMSKWSRNDLGRVASLTPEGRVRLTLPHQSFLRLASTMADLCAKPTTQASPIMSRATPPGPCFTAPASPSISPSCDATSSPSLHLHAARGLVPPAAYTARIRTFPNLGNSANTRTDISLPAVPFLLSIAMNIYPTPTDFGTRGQIFQERCSPALLTDNQHSWAKEYWVFEKA